MQPESEETSPRMALALNQHRLAVAIKFSVIVLAVIAFYFQDLTMVFTGALTNESTYHILAIPFLFIYLLFRKRKMANASLLPSQAKTGAFRKYFDALVGVLLCASAVLVYWYGSYTFTPLEYHMLTLPFLAAGLVLILFGTQTLKQLIFPIAFLIFLTPPPDEILYGLGSALANLSASASNSVADVFGLHATLSSSNTGPVITLLRPNNVALPFNVDVACSGIYSIIGFTIFALVIAYITRGKLINKLAILILGIPLILALNIIRITTVLAIGYNFGEDLALQLFHAVGATVLMFVGTLVLLAITEKAFPKPKPVPLCPSCNLSGISQSEPFCSGCGKLLKFPKTKLKKSDCAKIAGIAIAVIMLLSIQVPVFALTLSPPQVMMQTPSGPQINTSSAMLPNVTGYTLNYVYRDIQFEQTSGDDAALVYAYGAPNGTAPTVWVSIQIAASTESEHRWETCLINFPLSQGDTTKVTQLDLRDIQLQENPPMTARYFAIQYKGTNLTQVILYWYETATFETNGTAQTKSVMMSLVTYPQYPQNLTEAENLLQPVAEDVNGYWQPIQTWSPVAFALSQNGLGLAAAAAAVLVALIVNEVYQNRREKASLKTLYSKLPRQMQLLILAVINAQKKGKPTTSGVAGELQKIAESPTSETWLKEKLQEAQNAGLIQQSLASSNDEPAIHWINRTQTSKLPREKRIAK